MFKLENTESVFIVYVLYSPKYNKHYTGYTADIVSRLVAHNHLSKYDWTKRYRPWKLIHTENFTTKAEASRREKWLKTGVGREFIRSLPH
jgi:putative endonuclease